MCLCLHKRVNLFYQALRLLDAGGVPHGLPDKLHTSVGRITLMLPTLLLAFLCFAGVAAAGRFLGGIAGRVTRRGAVKPFPQDNTQTRCELGHRHRRGCRCWGLRMRVGRVGVA